MVSIKSMGAVALVFFGGYLYVRKSPAPIQKCELTKETDSSETLEKRKPASVPDLKARLSEEKAASPEKNAGTAPPAAPVTAKKFRSSYGRTPEELKNELRLRVSLDGLDLERVLRTDPERMQIYCAEGMTWACHLYAKNKEFGIDENGSLRMYEMDYLPDATLGNSAALSCLDLGLDCRSAFIFTRGTEEAEALEKSLSSKCSSGDKEACITFERETLNLSLDPDEYCGLKIDCEAPASEIIEAKRQRAIDSAAKNCQDGTISSCYTLIYKLDKDDPLRKFAKEQQKWICDHPAPQGPFCGGSSLSEEDED